MDGYIRVSRRQGRAGPGYISPTVQREAIERWAAYKGVTIDQWHIDEDESGGTHDRPGLEVAVARAIAGDTAGIVSWKIDRFSRMTENALRDLRLLQEKGARLAFTFEDIDSSGPMGKFVYTLMVAMAEFFLENIKAGWTTAKTRAIERGAHIGPTPYGYLRGADGTLYPDPDRASAVTDAYVAAATAGPVAALTLLEARAPERTWRAHTVRRFLANRAYLGEVQYGDHANREAHEPLTTPAIFTAAQYESTGQRRPKGDFPLSGIASCRHCGSKMVGARGGADNRRMYRCADHRACERPAVITAELLEVHVLDVAKSRYSRTFQVGEPTEGLEAAERALMEAEAELDEFAADTTARRVLKHRYHDALQARVDDVDEAREALRAALAAGQPTSQISAEMWDTLEPAELAEGLRASLEAVIVTKGRGPVASRVEVIGKGDDRRVVPGAEDADEEGV